MTKKRSEPLASTVGSPWASEARSSEVTARPSCVTPPPGRARKRTWWPLSTKEPAESASEALSRISAFEEARPKLLSPSLSHRSPASVSHPVSLVSRPTRSARHASMLRRSACRSAAGRAAAAPECAQGTSSIVPSSIPAAALTRAPWSRCMVHPPPGGVWWRYFMPSRIAPEDLLAHVRDLPRARGTRPLTALGARAAVAARTDDARGLAERVPDPGDVQYLGDRVEHLGSRLGNTRFAAPVQALPQDRIDHRLARHAVRGERRRQVHAHRQHVRIACHVMNPERVTAVQERALAIAQHRDLRSAHATIAVDHA